MSRKSTENLRKEVAKYRKKGLSFNEIARIMNFTPQYAHYLTKPLIHISNINNLDKDKKKK